MKKIFPFIKTKNDKITYLNYSNYLNWIKEEINAMEDYLLYFKPHYEILNAQLDYINTNNWSEKSTDSASTEKINNQNSEQDENFEIKITVTGTNPEGQDISGDKYLIFPSKLGFRQGFQNTRPEAYLCYFEPSQIKEYDWKGEQWASFIEKDNVSFIPPSMIVMSKYWRHSGVQEDSNPEGFGRDKYILISKPSSSWYLINTSKDEINFSFVPSALNDAGSIITFSLELTPSRYINTNRDNWGKGASVWSMNAAEWRKINQIIPDSKNIISQDGAIWSNNYPIMHEIELVDNDTHEEFIVDNYFTTTRENMANHPTHSYHIHTNLNQDTDTDNDMWANNIKVLIC